MMAKAGTVISIDLSWTRFAWNAKALGKNTAYLFGFKRK
jgi:hypothetical protein